jgi:hypothetical protein
MQPVQQQKPFDDIVALKTFDQRDAGFVHLMGKLHHPLDAAAVKVSERVQ